MFTEQSSDIESQKVAKLIFNADTDKYLNFQMTEFYEKTKLIYLHAAKKKNLIV